MNGGFQLIRRIPIFDALPGSNEDREKQHDTDTESWKELNISYAGFCHVNTNITQYAKQLTILNLSHNNISSINPNVFLSLLALESLDLSQNLLETLPREVGNLTRLSVLRLNANLLIELPPEVGRLLGKMSELSLKDNPNLQMPPAEILVRGLEETLRFLRERIRPVSQVPRRKWISTAHEVITPRAHTVLCYNILAERYSTEKMYFYCPSWALRWEHRANLILHDLLNYDADVLCLQEVEGDKYDSIFRIEMDKAGYDSIFKAKGRAQTMDVEEGRKVDGCATFFRRSRYQLVRVEELDYTQIALARDTEFMDGKDLQDSVSRLMRTDNVGMILILAERADPRQTLLVSNTHLHWNPMLSDVKLLQAQFLLEKVEELAAETNASICVCGDFNSEPDSAVYKLITTGFVSSSHVDMRGSKFGKYATSGRGYRHHLKLVSCNHVPYTNFTSSYCGVLDYVFCDISRLKPLGYLAVHSKEEVRRDVARPSIQAPSDHFSLVCKIGET